LDIGLVVIIPAVVALLLRLTWHRVPLENNGSVFLYDAVFGTSECPAAGQSGTVAILRFFHRIFGNRWNYRWIRGVYTFFTVWAMGGAHRGALLRGILQHASLPAVLHE
jgi:hypothetical protein